MIDILIDKSVLKSKVLSVFDFDGTLTYYDSFILFLNFAFGKFYFAKKLLKMTLPVLHYAICKLTRDELKEILIKTFLTDIEEQWLRQQAEIFCNKYWKKLMRPAGIAAVAEEISNGSEVTICSASPELILQPWADRLYVKLIGTQLETTYGRLTGYIDGYNCRGAQKVTSLKRVYGDLSKYHLRAWGDTRGDHELLEIAQDPHWKCFHLLRAKPQP